MERGSWKPNVEISPSCPRCGSSNTKFCYYNNYSTTQPRYFCKGCRRYWTKGGSLRNVPVGGGCRKNRRSESLRQSSGPNNFLHNKNYGFGGVMNNNHDPIRHAYNKGIVAPSLEPSSSSVVADGSHIDLAIVYANFLNPQQENSKNTDTCTGLEVPELPGEFDSSLETFPTALEPSNVVQLPQHNAGRFGCLTNAFDDHLSIDHHHCHGNDHQVGLNHMDHHQLIYYSGLESSLTQHKHQDVISYDHQQCFDHNNKRNPTGLPPLPGEETWPNSDHIAGLHKPPVFGNETDQDPDVLFGNWSPFYLSSTGDDAFSKST